MLLHPLPEGQTWVAEELKEEKARAQGGWGAKAPSTWVWGRTGVGLIPGPTLRALLL